MLTVIAIIAICLTVALLLWSLTKGLQRLRLRPYFDVARILVQVAVAVAIPAITGVTMSIGLVVGSVVVGLILGLAQSRGLLVELIELIELIDDDIFVSRSMISFMIWGGGLVLMQAAGLANRTGLVQIGQAVT